MVSDNAAQIYTVAKRFNLLELKENCLRYIDEYTNEILDAPVSEYDPQSYFFESPYISSIRRHFIADVAYIRRQRKHKEKPYINV